MKQSLYQCERRLGRARLFTLLATLVLCAGFAVPSIGSAGGNGETVGTLPGTSGGGGGIDIGRSFRDSRPAFYLEGPIGDINAAVSGYIGRTIVTEEVLDAATQIVRLTFHGDLELELDRQVFEQGSIKIGWTVPQAFGPARVTMLAGDETIATGMVSGRSLVLPVSAMDASGALDAAPLSIVASGRNGSHAALEVTTGGGELILSQIH